MFHLASFVSSAYVELFPLANRVTDVLNSARGHLRVLLARWLWGPLGVMVNADCNGKEKTVFQYLKALVKTGGYPIDQQGRKSVNQVCQDLETFDKHFNQPESPDCANCGRDWDSVVENAIREVKKHFDGLCLDCMDHSQPKFLDEHMDYWDHLTPKQWDLPCRVSHGQATWYSSFSKSLIQLYSTKLSTDKRSGTCRHQRLVAKACSSYPRARVLALYVQCTTVGRQ